MSETHRNASVIRAVLRWLPLLALGLIAVGLMATTDRFFNERTFSSILTQAAIIGVLAVGQAFVLIGGGFDLSQGSTLALTGALVAWLAVAPPAGLAALITAVGPIGLAALALIIGGALGSVNGFFVAYVETNPFVTTLSTLLIYRGATFLLLGGEPIVNVEAFDALRSGIPLGSSTIEYRSMIFLGLVVVAWVVLGRTVFGQHLYATGGNARAARLAGVRTRRIRTAAFALSGASAGLAAVLWLSRHGIAKVDTAEGYELLAIASCVVGGISLRGGVGNVLGAGFGCLLLQTLDTLITLRRWPDEYSTLITGAVILTFAAADSLVRRGRD